MRYLILFAVMVIPIFVVSCSALDWATGADQPAVEGGDPSLATEPAPIDTAIDAIRGTGPIGAGAAALLAYLAGQYRERRRKAAA